MLKKFSVENFKGFDEEIVFDLAGRDYAYNTNLLKNKIVNKAIIYGKNGTGKSSIGLALFDIIGVLTDKNKLSKRDLGLYRNLNYPSKPVTFKYYFTFDNKEVKYTYSKFSPDDILYEKLEINDEVVIDYFHNYSASLLEVSYITKIMNNRFINEDLLGTLIVDFDDSKLSILKYISNNKPSSEIPIISKLINYCQNMLWFRSLTYGNSYAGFTNGVGELTEILFNSNRLDDFTKFLLDNGIEYKLIFKEENANHVLLASFNNDKNYAPFLEIASTGTKTLFLFYIWKITAFDKASLVFIDEFDAYLHYESSESIIKLLNDGTSFQSIVTTHNTSLINNLLTRPDCCFIMTKNKITSLKNSTNRELREGHNLEKLYKSGEFDE